MATAHVSDQQGSSVENQHDARVDDYQDVLPAGVERLLPDDPTQVGGYPLLGRLGCGGMGKVYLGRAEDGALVAVKMMHPQLAVDADFRIRFADEITLARRVAPFCTARILDHGEEAGRPYLVSEYIQGTSLAQLIETHPALPDSTVEGIAVGVATALAAIHAAGLVHRDLKPGNVILSVSGVRVIDFGIARALDSTSGLTQTGTVIGTAAWTAPELFTGGPLTPAADIFAWGCLMAYANTGRHPFGEGSPTTVAYRIVHDPPDLTGVSPSLYGLIEKALLKDPAARPNAWELLLELSGARRETRTGHTAPTPDGVSWLAPMALHRRVPATHGPVPEEETAVDRVISSHRARRSSPMPGVAALLDVFRLRRHPPPR